MSNQILKGHILNFNTDRRLFSKLYRKWAYLRPETRIPDVAQLIRKSVLEGGIEVLFEITEGVQEEIVELVTKDSTIQHISGTYNLSTGKTKNDGSFKYSIFLPDSIEVLKVENIAFTNAGLIPQITDGEETQIEHKEFSFFPDELRPKTDNDKRSSKWYMDITGGEFFEKSFMCLQLSSFGVEFYLIVTHMGLSEQARLKQSQKLVQWTKVNIPENSRIMLGGDFNAFKQSGGTYMDQMQVFLDCDFKNLVDFSVGTFKNYPYDIGYLIDEAHPSSVNEYIAKKYNVNLADNEQITLFNRKLYDEYVDNFKNPNIFDEFIKFNEFMENTPKRLYDEFVIKSRTNEPTETEIEAFGMLIEFAPQKTPPKATLDNLFVKGFEHECKCSIQDSSSDHFSLAFSIEL